MMEHETFADVLFASVSSFVSANFTLSKSLKTFFVTNLISFFSFHRCKMWLKNYLVFMKEIEYFENITSILTSAL